MELYKGLPHRTIHIEVEDGDIIFGVSTDEIGELLTSFFEDYTTDANTVTVLEEFDNSTSYFVPEEVFLNDDDETVIQYIKQNIDGNVTQ